jgi:hypothetical protein
MQEFSQRTHQGGVPRLAADYEPPVIDLAATDPRQRRVAGASMPRRRHRLGRGPAGRSFDDPVQGR